MEFHTAYNHPKAIPSPEGSPIVPIYERRVQADGTIELECVGEKNIQHEIDLASAGLTPYEVLDRYARCPDPEILHQMEKNYADFTAAPRSLAELEQFRIDARNAFYNLPASVRQLYHNNFNVFMQNPAAFDEFVRGMSDQGKKASQQAAAAAAEGSAANGQASEGAASVANGVKIG